MKTAGNFKYWYKDQEFSEDNFYKTILDRIVKIDVDKLNVIARDV
jgi:hypothetical protein